MRDSLFIIVHLINFNIIAINQIIIIIMIKTMFIQANLFSRMNLLLSAKDMYNPTIL